MTKENERSSTVVDDDIVSTLGLELPLVWWRRKILWGVVVFCIVVLVTVLLSWRYDKNSQSIRYKTAKVQRGDLIVTVTATGSLEPVNQVEVGSEISGAVKTVAVDFNDRVKQGQVLATLDTGQLQAQVNQARAALQLAQAQVKQAEATVREMKNKLRRARELAKTDMCSEEDCDAAQAAYDRAEANLLSTKAQVVQSQAYLDAQQTTLSKATIHSPINGIVLDRSVEPGQTVAASLQTPVLFTLAEDLTQMELHVDVDEADVGQVNVGLSAIFTVDAYPDRRFPAEITEVHFASQTVEGVVTYETVLRVDNSELLLRPGMTAMADITVNKVKDALLVSNAALRFTPSLEKSQASTRGGSLVSQLIPRPSRSGSKLYDEMNTDNAQRRVWILHDGQPAAIPVSTGATDGIMIEIISGEIESGMILLLDTLKAGA